ncbi:hypothetical protein SEPCBS57363_001783 [Sporothrix epigloea]|uniref:Zn(2)-C6 fungal-type domain-containing protein n=1 Tax=Sporothrix epigloea TaxID=1892477 RepID=A0ABP0DFB6_9PEZI
MSSAPVNTTSLAQRKRARRVIQACDNCRRKKAQCPRERPECSSCTRLGQSCRYQSTEASDSRSPNQHVSGRVSGDSQGNASYPRSVEDRIARLEAKLDASQGSFQDRPDAASGSRPEGKAAFDLGLDGSEITADSRNPHGSARFSAASLISTSRPITRLLPSTRVVGEAIRVYFSCCHRQPVWLFEPKSALSTTSPDAVILCILALGTQYSPGVLAGPSGEPLKSPDEYNDAARRAILQDLANSAVNLATLQALCLLSFSNLVSGDVQLASFHVSLAANLMQSAGLDMHRSNDRTPLLESQRRLFWSVQMVNVLCGAPVKIPSTYDIKAPSFAMQTETTATFRRHAGDVQPAPLLPLDPPSIGIRRSGANSERAPPHITSIWLHMVRSASLWSLVRSYIWRCHQNQQHPPKDPRAPWHPDSDYTAIHAQLFDMEGAFPVAFRYDASRFMDRPLAELLCHRDFWLPWLKIQVTYHTIHAVLNHPLLYTPRVSQMRPGGPNWFWKASTDLALLHSTWIARILGMAQNKSLPMSDPFFAYASSVAITLHLYWSRASSLSIRTAAKKYIDVCRSVIAELATHWPLCRDMKNNVDQLLTLSFYPRSQSPDVSEHTQTSTQRPISQSPTTLANSVSQIWRILDFAGCQQPNAPMGKSLFHASLKNNLQLHAATPHPIELEDPQVESPPEDFQTLSGDYSGPPDWFASPDVPAATTAAMLPIPPPATASRPVDAQTSEMAYNNQIGHATDDTSFWTPWETAQLIAGSAPPMTLDPFSQLYLSRNAPDYSQWWDAGTL